MQMLIKQIREYLNITKSDFAKLMQVSFATINHWESGKSAPGKSKQLKLYNICKENNIDVYQMILNKIFSITSSIDTKDNKIILYHGSKSGINGRIEPKSRDLCDFGKGFYMGTEPSQALTLICDYDTSILYIVTLNIENTSHLEISADIDWAMLVAYNRGRMKDISDTRFYNKYKNMATDKDIIIGNIANDRMFYVIDSFFQGSITDSALVNSLSALKLGKQYVAVTQKGCDSVKIEREITLSYLERLFIKEASENNRKNGISLANDICKNYRREGLFFDEILDKAKMEAE